MRLPSARLPAAHRVSGRASSLWPGRAVSRVREAPCRTKTQEAALPFLMSLFRPAVVYLFAVLCYVFSVQSYSWGACSPGPCPALTGDGRGQCSLGREGSRGLRPVRGWVWGLTWAWAPSPWRTLHCPAGLLLQNKFNNEIIKNFELATARH